MRTELDLVRQTAAATFAGALLFTVPAAQSATVPIAGVDASGYASLVNFNNEEVEPNSGLPGSKDFDYPYYWDPDRSLWIMLVAEPLAAASTYAQEDTFSVLNKSITDADFGDFGLGDIDYDDSLVPATGSFILGPESLNVTIDATELSPLLTPRNVNNEFAWSYAVRVTNLRGAGIEFLDGTVIDIDLLGDVEADVLLLGQNATTPGFSQADAFRIDGAALSFDLDQTTSQNAFFLGTIENARLIINRSGTLDAVEPLIDTDGDGVFDNQDNCLLVANPLQTDGDGDGYGNRCDADLNGDCIVNPVDLGLFRAAFFTADPAVDFDSSGIVNVIDLGILRTLFFAPPGPSALSSACDG